MIRVDVLLGNCAVGIGVRKILFEGREKPAAMLTFDELNGGNGYKTGDDVIESDLVKSGSVVGIIIPDLESLSVLEGKIETIRKTLEAESVE